MIKPKTLTFALLITAAMTLPLKAAEQCCQPCPNGVLVGVTADSCGTCADLATLIPGCASTAGGKCTACFGGFYLSNGTCLPCSSSLSGCISCSNGAACTSCGPGFKLENGLCTVTGGGGGTIESKVCNSPNGSIPFLNCTECASGGNGQSYNRYQHGCKTCINGTTRVAKNTQPQICGYYPGGAPDYGTVYGCNTIYYTTYYCE